MRNSIEEEREVDNSITFSIEARFIEARAIDLKMKLAHDFIFPSCIIKTELSQFTKPDRMIPPFARLIITSI